VTAHKKKLIEVALPLDVINAESAKEKTIRQGHPSTLHLWWARRPLAACRAILFAQLVDDPSADEEKFPTIEAQNKERRRLFGIVEELVKWENINNKKLLAEARKEIILSSGGEQVKILDPFAGGGSIPLEAKRLGLEAYANDLNPLPVLLNIVLLNLVGRFKLNSPTSGGMDCTSPQALSEDLSYWAKRLEERVEKRVGLSYANPNGIAVPLVFFWSRTITCPNPACDIEIPLVSSWNVSDRKNSECHFKPVLLKNEKSVDVSVHFDKEARFEPTIHRTGGKCFACGTTFSLDFVKSEAQANKVGVRLLAIQEKSMGENRNIRPATDLDRELANVKHVELDWLDVELSTHPQYMAPPRFGLTKFSDLFLDRQLKTLGVFVEELVKIQVEIQDQVNSVLATTDDRHFIDGGEGAVAYAEALRILLALGVSRLINRASSLCIWDASRMTVAPVFARQAYSMSWLFVEANPLAGASGSYSGQVKYLAKAIEQLPMTEGHVTQGPAQHVSVPDNVVVSTDPPYYDSVPYADLSDYSLVWLREMLKEVLPTVFNTILSPKDEELVADHVRHGGKFQAANFFEHGLADVFTRLRASHSDSVPMTVYYAFKAHENAQDGQAPSGWETFLQSLITAGWSISGTWPVRTEQMGGLRALGRNALASSVVVVCRKRPADAGAINRRNFLTHLREELPFALRALQEGNIAPVDLAQAAIGPGMSIFSRYSRVTEADGKDMSVRTALALINQILDEVLSEQEGDFDSDTRFAIKWFLQFGWNSGPSHAADTLAKAVNTSVTSLERGGIFRATAGKANLISPESMLGDWDPKSDKNISIWEVTIKVAHTLATKGLDAATNLSTSASSRVDMNTVKELSYLLYSICEKKGWSEAAMLFNGLGSSWQDLHSNSRTAPLETSTQIELDLG